ncbi:hypothetical protein MVEN_00323700 [Mycena venus]|uniref:Uncharacterized protein n=1 Tax=Mycena venus TaxID=2733690 RepID=A0A8H6YST9_9AGAR|nr:hypothetical protein MVEN_00323700 [Mycena venus]
MTAGSITRSTLFCSCHQLACVWRLPEAAILLFESFVHLYYGPLTLFTAALESDDTLPLSSRIRHSYLLPVWLGRAPPYTSYVLLILIQILYPLPTRKYSFLHLASPYLSEATHRGAASFPPHGVPCAARARGIASSHTRELSRLCTGLAMGLKRGDSASIVIWGTFVISRLLAISSILSRFDKLLITRSTNYPQCCGRHDVYEMA